MIRLFFALGLGLGSATASASVIDCAGYYYSNRDRIVVTYDITDNTRIVCDITQIKSTLKELQSDGCCNTDDYCHFKGHVSSVDETGTVFTIDKIVGT